MCVTQLTCETRPTPALATRIATGSLFKFEGSEPPPCVVSLTTNFGNASGILQSLLTLGRRSDTAYPSVIIVPARYVAHGASRAQEAAVTLESLPTVLDLTVNTMATSLHQSRVHRRSEVPVVNEQDLGSLRCREVPQSKDENRHTSKRKVEGIAFSQPPPNA